MSLQYDANGNLIDGQKLLGRKAEVQQIIGTGDATVSVAALATVSSVLIDVSAYKSVVIYVNSDQIYDATRYYSFNGTQLDQGNTFSTSQSVTSSVSYRYHAVVTNNDAVSFIKIQIKNDSTTTAANIKVYLVGMPN